MRLQTLHLLQVSVQRVTPHLLHADTHPCNAQTRPFLERIHDEVSAILHVQRFPVETSWWLNLPCAIPPIAVRGSGVLTLNAVHGLGAGASPTWGSFAERAEELLQELQSWLWFFKASTRKKAVKIQNFLDILPGKNAFSVSCTVINSVNWSAGDAIQRKSSFNCRRRHSLCPADCRPSLYQTGSLLFWTKDSIDLRYQRWRLNSFVRPFQQRPEERKQLNFWKGPRSGAYSTTNFSSSQWSPFYRAFFSFWKQMGMAGGYCHRVKGEEKKVKRR